MDVESPSPIRQGLGTAGEAASLRRLGGFRSLEDAVKLRLDGGPTAASAARRALAKLRSELDPPLLESLRLLVTELITNAVRHAGARKVELLVVVSQPAVRVEVVDPGPGFDPERSTKTRDHHGGWGLFLVDRLADRWGVIQEGEGTRVWFELERRI
jgi:anti-sigma regulatory factor (Ser/Thr protein kinase)